MTDREAMQQALDALDRVMSHGSAVQEVKDILRERLAQPEHDWEAAYTKQVELHNQTLDELRDALAQPEQEHIIDCPRCGHCCPQQPEQEPVCAHGVGKTKCDFCKQPEQELVCVCGAIWEGQELVSTPPQRKPLTHPQIHELDWPDDVSFEDILVFARAVEAAHGIKGEA